MLFNYWISFKIFVEHCVTFFCLTKKISVQVYLFLVHILFFIQRNKQVHLDEKWATRSKHVLYYCRIDAGRRKQLGFISRSFRPTLLTFPLPAPDGLIIFQTPSALLNPRNLMLAHFPRSRLLNLQLSTFITTLSFLINPLYLRRATGILFLRPNTIKCFTSP